ncbi:MAG: hypothetical protein EZS28_038983, partial [Streblomastix strix]
SSVASNHFKQPSVTRESSDTESVVMKMTQIQEKDLQRETFPAVVGADLLKIPMKERREQILKKKI